MMRPFGASPSSHPCIYGTVRNLALHFLSIIRSLPLPAFVSFCSRSSSVNSDFSVQQIRHNSTKLRPNFRTLRSFPRPHLPNDTPHPPQQLSPDSSPPPPGFHLPHITPPAQRFPRVDSLAKGIKAASGFVKGFKDAIRVIRRIEAPIGDFSVGLGAAGGIVVGLKAAKVVTKSLQMSKGIFTTLQSRNMIPRGAAFVLYKEKLTFLLKGFKAFDGAFTILHFSIGGASQRELAQLRNWNSFQKGYKLSKSVVNVLEVILLLKLGIISSVGQGFLLLKRATEGVGVMVKAAFLYKEIYMVLLKGLGFSRDNLAAFETVFHNFFERNSDARLHRDISNRKLYITAAGRKFDVSLTLASPRSSCSDLMEKSSVILLVDSLCEANVNLHSCRRMEVDHSHIFLLAIPLPSKG